MTNVVGRTLPFIIIVIIIINCFTFNSRVQLIMNASEQVRVFRLTSSYSREDLEGNVMEIFAVTQ